ncbi:MAG TPA: metallophosphoesterase, partial [Kofleriaceae bacterium]|nr:metallophosphoesterase [Kofleriaceae bacterium]
MRLVAGVSTLVIVLAAWSARAGADPFRKGPYLQNVTERSITLMWESDRRVPGTVRLLDASGTPLRTLEAETSDIHEVVVDGLEAGRRYRYQVECDGEMSAGEFATGPATGAPFSFVVFGDSRSNANTHARVVERVRREVPDFILGTGDMVDNGSREDEWQTFFDIERDLLRENVLFPSLGNHDRQGRGRTADNFRKYFSLPENSPDPERYYAFTYSNARFLVLDSNAYAFALTDQTAWIEQQLQQARLNPAIKFIFITMHHPPYSVSLHGGRTELRDAWTPLYEKYGVTAVFSGHDHVYSRAEKNNVKYFVSGGGGAPLYPRSRKPSPLDVAATKYFERTNHYLRAVIVGDQVEITAIRADGSLMETVSWGAAPRPPEALTGLRPN